jgi:hypothetical protein
LPVAGTPTKANCDAAAKTLNVLLVAAVSDKPAALVAVKVTPVPAVGKIIPVTTIELEPEFIVPVVVPVIVPAFPLEVNEKEEFDAKVVAAP